MVGLFFGYTHCPDFCPTTLAAFAQVMRQLGPDAERVQVLFVTLDPQRDTQAVLARYVPAFEPRFLGLYAEGAATRRTAKEFRIFYQKEPGQRPGDYSLDHGSQSYVFDTERALASVGARRRHRSGPAARHPRAAEGERLVARGGRASAPCPL